MLKENYTSIHGKLIKCLSDLSDKQLKSLHRAVHYGIKGHFSKQISVDIPLSEDATSRPEERTNLSAISRRSA